MDQASRTIERLRELEIDMDHVAWQLEHEGVQKFIDAYNAAIQALDSKRQRHASREMHVMGA